MRTSLLLCVVIALPGVGCGGSATQPLAPTAVASSQRPPTLVGSGSRSLSAIGETSQLIAVATGTDGTTRDVTVQARWTSRNPSVVTVSSSGLATAAGFGAAQIEAAYESLLVTFQIEVTPAGTFAVTGSVREPGQGAVSDVRVREQVSGKSTLTDQLGNYTLAALLSRHLRFEKDGYEPVDLDVAPDSPGFIGMQRSVRITAGETAIVPKLTHMDVSYDVGSDRCSPCRLIRIVAPTAGTMHFELAWDPNPGSALYLWVGGQRFGGNTNEKQFAADAPINTGENVVYVGYYRWTIITGSSIKLTLATAMSR
jgi:hypothetical protein